jgi:hypothetical protein
VAKNHKRRPGRPAKLEDPQTRARFFRVLRKTGSRAFACQVAGIADNTLRNHEGRDAAFAAEVEEAEQETLNAIEANVLISARKDPDLGLKVLERKRKGWQKQQQINHTGHVGLNVAAVSVSRQELLNDPDYIEFLRGRAIEGDGHSSPLCANGQQGKVANGTPSRLGGPGVG